ncbi:MAG: redoxin domain-containing protein, partial [Myxococcota bacterium]
APEGLSEEARAEAAAEAAAAILKEEPATPTPPTPTPAATDAAPVETKRVMLQPARAEVPLGPKTPLKGPKDAPVTIVLFEDFQCPFCRKLAGNLHALMDARPADVRVAWYHFPMLSDCNDHVKKDMHPQACLAAMAGVCAEEQGKFWEMHDTMFSNNARLSARDIRKYAQLEGLALGAFDTCMRAPETLAQVKADASVGAELGVGGTPTFFVNGRRLAGAQPVEVLEAVVDAVQQKDQQERVRLDVALRGEIIGDIGQVPGEVTLDGPYGRFTIDAFEAHVVDGVAKSIPGAEPTRGLSWYDASAACEAAGKRLCSEEEWLSACTGAIPNDLDGDGIYSDDPIQGRRHPYGDYPLENYCASSREKDDARPLIAGNHPKCVTPEGVYDMEGNLKEWIGLAPDRAGLKGGSYFSRNSARCGYFKKDVPPDGADDSMGFRCCRGKDPVDDSAERYPGGKVGDAVQAWSLPTPRGGDFGTADLKGKPFIMTFWASWCGPCRKELPALAALYEKYKDQGLVVVGVNVDRDRNKAKGFLRDMPLPFPVVLDTENELMGRFDAQSVPTTFWVTADGDIRQKTEGYDDRKKDDLETYLTELMRR